MVFSFSCAKSVGRRCRCLVKHLSILCHTRSLHNACWCIVPENYQHKERHYCRSHQAICGLRPNLPGPCLFWTRRLKKLMYKEQFRLSSLAILFFYNRLSMHSAELLPIYTVSKIFNKGEKILEMKIALEKLGFALPRMRGAFPKWFSPSLELYNGLNKVKVETPSRAMFFS